MLTYGRVGHAEEAIQCFLNQKNCPSAELIVFNSFLPQRLNGDFPNVKIINATVRPPALGACRNEAIKHATGEVCVTWDDDSLFAENHLANYAKHFDDPNIQWVTLSHQFYLERWLIKSVVPGSCDVVAYRRSAHEKVGGYPAHLNCGEDRAFISKLSALPGKKVDLKPNEISYYYAFGNGVYHTSGLGDDKPGQKSGHDRIYEYTMTRLNLGQIPGGDIVLKPEVLHDYEAMRTEFISKSTALQVKNNGWSALKPGYAPAYTTDLEKLKPFPKVTIVYVHVPGDPEHTKMASRFVTTYTKCPPGLPHDTLLICNGRAPAADSKKILSSLPNCSYFHWNDIGWDIGAYIAAVKHCTSDIIVCFGGHSYFKRGGWLVRMIEAWKKHGPGVYGSLASYQISPHLNTTGFWCEPKLLANYPKPVVTRLDRYNFEHGPDAFWKIAHSKGLPALLVTWDGEYDWTRWREPKNGFRAGDQSDCLTYFKHTDIYDQLTDPAIRQKLFEESETLTDMAFLKMRNKPISVRTVHSQVNPVSAVIAVYKPSVQRLNRCLAHILNQVAEIIVVGDLDTPWPMAGVHSHPKIRLVQNPHLKTGYGKKANFGVKYAREDFILFLNDDVFLDGDTVTKLLSQMSDEVAVVTHLLKYPDGRIQYAGKERGDNQFGHLDHLQSRSRYLSPVEEESVCGASMLVRKKAFQEVKGFDESYYLYSEDDDLAMRLRQKKWRIIFNPLASGVHEEHASTGITPAWQSIMKQSGEQFSKKWGWYFERNKGAQLGTFGNVTSETKLTLVRRKIAAGDVLLTTPIIRRLKELAPDSYICVETEYPEIFRDNPDVSEATKGFNPKSYPSEAVSKMHDIDLNMAYEDRPGLSILTAYCETAVVSNISPHLSLYPNESELQWAKEQLAGRWCAINLGDSVAHAQGKFWPVEKHSLVVDHLHYKGFKVVLIGKQSFSIGSDLDLTGKTTIHQLAAIIKQSELFIGIDSFPLHVACAMETKSIGLFGVTLPNLILANQENCYPVASDPNHQFTGYRHKIVTNGEVRCEPDPMETITVEMVLSKIELCISQKPTSTAISQPSTVTPATA